MSRLWLSSLSGLLALPAYAPNPEALPCVNARAAQFKPNTAVGHGVVVEEVWLAGCASRTWRNPKSGGGKAP